MTPEQQSELIRLLKEAHDTMLDGYDTSGDWYSDAERLLASIS